MYFVENKPPPLPLLSHRCFRGTALSGSGKTSLSLSPGITSDLDQLWKSGVSKFAYYLCDIKKESIRSEEKDNLGATPSPVYGFAFATIVYGYPKNWFSGENWTVSRSRRSQLRQYFTRNESASRSAGRESQDRHLSRSREKRRRNAESSGGEA